MDILKVRQQDFLMEWIWGRRERQTSKIKSRMPPRFLAWTDELPIIEMRKATSRASLGRKIRSSVLAMLSLRCLTDFQEEIQSMRLNIWIWTSGRTCGLEIQCSWKQYKHWILMICVINESEWNLRYYLNMKQFYKTLYLWVCFASSVEKGGQIKVINNSSLKKQ